MLVLMGCGLALLCALAGCGGDAPPATADAGVDLGGADGSLTDMPFVPPIDAGGDAGCTTDADGDGHRALECGGDDCDDSDPSRFPGNPERCDTLGHDEDCNNTTLGPDVDRDGFISIDCCNTQPGGAVACGDDCDDGVGGANAHPGAAESCNGVDDDCNGLIDDHDVLLTFFHDVDGDGYGDSAVSMSACTAPLGYVLTGGDCDDIRPSSHPGAVDGPTTACDGRDNDCDGTPDRGCPCIDGATQPCGATNAMGMLIMVAPCHAGLQTCTGAVWGTCVGSVVPMPETCNAMDDDCDGLIDDGATVACYADGDRDGFAPAGAALMMICADTLGRCPVGYADTPPSTASTTDCNDTQATVHPGALEACNMLDDDCDGIVDDGAGVPQWRDADGDGHGAGAMVTACVLMSGYATNSDDCDDTSSAFRPGAPEPCDGLDENCDGVPDNTDLRAADWCIGLPHTAGMDVPSNQIGYCTRYFSGFDERWGCRTGDFGTTHYDCTEGWAECDPARLSGGNRYVLGADGCETDASTATNCGRCGVTCLGAERCCLSIDGYRCGTGC